MRIATIVSIATMLALGTVALAQKVTYDFDKTADFSRFKTYAWAPGANLNDELNHKRIVAAVDTQLAAKGLTKIEPSQNPDVLVVYHAKFDKDLQISGSSSGGPYRLVGFRTGSARVEQVLVGDLAVDVLDARTRSLVWRGIASKEVDAKASPEKRDKNINKAVEKLFKNFPPKK